MAHREAQITETGDIRQRFFRTVRGKARLPNDVDMDDAISAVTCALTERLNAGEAHVLFDALPPSVRPFFARCVAHRDGRPGEHLDRVGFLDRVARHLDITPAHAELVCAAVFGALRGELPSAVVRTVAAQLPHGLRELWCGEPIVPAPLATKAGDDARRIVEQRIRTQAPLPSGVTADAAFTAVMCGLSHRLSGGEARRLLLSLPDSIRPLIGRCVRHRDEPPTTFDGGQFADSVREHLGCTPAEVAPIVETVFAAVAELLPSFARRAAASQLPPDLRALWLAEREEEG